MEFMKIRTCLLKISAGLRMHKLEGATSEITLDSNRGIRYYSKGELTNSRKCLSLVLGNFLKCSCILLIEI